MKLRRGLVAAFAVLLALIVAPTAQAVAPAEVFVEGSGGVACVELSGGIRECNGPTHTWDGTRVDVNVFLPSEADGPGPYPTIGDFHGWGSSKQGLNTVPIGAKKIGKNTFVATSEVTDPRIRHWAEEGYAVFSMSDRGWGKSCGAFDPYLKEEEKEIEEEQKEEIKPGERAKTDCARGYNHLMDDRFEVRDAQFLLSRLADEGLVEPKKIGVTGVSYGGGISIALASLRNRVMEETLTGGGKLIPWTSPEGKEMEIAAAAPQWPWTDLAYSLAPNGRNLDYVTNSPYRGPSGKLPIGVWKASWSEGLNVAGEAISNYEPNDPLANVQGWLLRFKAGDPYSDASIEAIVNQLSTYHSSFGIDSSIEPSPMLIQSGWNDDLFPVDEALRFYQRTRATYPDNPISLYLADIGHSRSQEKEADVAAFNQRLDQWFGHYLKGEGEDPTSSVEALTTTCPKAAPSEGPFRAADWAGLQPGEISLQASGSQTITPGSAGEVTASSFTFDPIEGTKSPCTALPIAQVENAHAVTYSLDAAPAGGYTLMGSPTIIADVESPSPNSEIAARLLDVSPEGTESLVARGIYRPSGGEQEMVFQLHPQGYHFAAGHVAKLELLPSDFPYARYSNLQGKVTVSNLELRLPVTEAPGSLGGMVQAPKAKVVPAGYTLAKEFQTESSGGGGGGGAGGGSGGSSPSPKPAPAPVKIGAGGFAGKFSANRKVVIVPVRCTGEGACSGQVSISVKKPGGKGRTVLASGAYSVVQGTTAQARLPLTKAGKKIVTSLIKAHSRKVAGVINLIDSGRPSLIVKRPVQLPHGN